MILCKNSIRSALYSSFYCLKTDFYVYHSCKRTICIYNGDTLLQRRLVHRQFGSEISKQFSSDKKDVDIDIPVENIRNFSIIAHVDHGKSTLADRLLEITGAIDRKCGQSQILDNLQVERERGITVKAQTASLRYNLDGCDYLLNLVDTPGHVDFSNEVSRSLAACQGVILLVDANQGVQAQTVANFYLAFTKDLVILPVLNKIDLKNSDPDGVTKQLNNVFGINDKDVLRISAKHGTGVDALIRAIVERIPPPNVNRNSPFRALLFDSWYDRYRGAISLLYITDGSIKVGDTIGTCHGENFYEVKSLGILKPEEEPVKSLIAGQVGTMSCNMRSAKEANVGDTLYLKNNPVEALPDFKPAHAMIFAGIYPVDQSQHVALRNAIEKLTMNDSAVSVAVESSPALGLGWRLGFLGILHLEVFSQRLEQEYGAQVIATAPSVTYKANIKGVKNVKKYHSSEIVFSNPADFPDPLIVSEFFEPLVLGTIITPDTYLGPVVQVCIDRRGIQKTMQNIDDHRIMMQFILPLNEIVVDFHDTLKSLSSGYASFDYEEYGYHESNLVKLVILLNNVPVDELSTIVHASKASTVGRKMCEKLKEFIPRQMVMIAVQAAVGGKIIARETIKAYRKDVTAKLYGGDVTRRMKLLKQQAEGKKKMRSIANINVPRDIFIDILKR